MSLLDKIRNPQDLKLLSDFELDQLCKEIREFLVQNVSQTGGHLASNLGITEIAVSIERVFDTSRDRLVFDVGHQCYVHKLLTERKELFFTLRQTGGLAGFPKPAGSPYDAFIAGHASNSVSVALGMARAFAIQKSPNTAIALIGDGALTGGLAYEGLCDAGVSKLPLIVVLNDNGMSIARNVGGMSKHLSHLRIRPGYMRIKSGYRSVVQRFPGGKAVYRFSHGLKTIVKNAVLHCSMFEDMGFYYIGPVDGHNVQELCRAMTSARLLHRPVLIHAITKKGKGYGPAEKNPDLYHGVSPFDPAVGIQKKTHETFSSVFGQEMVALAEKNERVMAVTAAMKSGTGLSEFSGRFPERFVDTGISEGHAAAMCAGASACGAIPVFAVYSTFLQRSFDMLVHDVAIMGNHVVFAVDRAGLVGEDGETHHGIFDLAMFSAIPGFTVYAPSDYSELRVMLREAVLKKHGPVAVRYPRGTEGAYHGCRVLPSQILQEGKDITIVSYGIMINTALQVASGLAEKGIQAEVIKLGVVVPPDDSDILPSVRKTKRLLVIEDVSANGSVGEKLAARVGQEGILLRQFILKNLGSGFVPHGKNSELYRFCGIDADSILDSVLEGF